MLLFSRMIDFMEFEAMGFWLSWKRERDKVDELIAEANPGDEFVWVLSKEHFMFIPTAETCCRREFPSVERAQDAISRALRSLPRKTVEQQWALVRCTSKLHGTVEGIGYYEAFHALAPPIETLDREAFQLGVRAQLGLTVVVPSQKELLYSFWKGLRAPLPPEKSPDETWEESTWAFFQGLTTWKG